MKIGFAGASGHFQECLHTRYEDIFYAGYCKSAVSEDVSPVKGAFERLGLYPREFNDYEQMLNCGIDTVVVDGIFNTHADFIIRALKKNINVISEKPLATTLEDYYKIKEELSRSEGNIFSLLTMRYQDSFNTVKILLENNAIGQIRLINAQKSYKLGQRPDFYKNKKTFGGIIPWIGIHLIDLVLWFTGRKVIGLNAYSSSMFNGGNGDLETAASVNMMLEDEITAVAYMDYYRPDTSTTHGDDRIRIVGTKGIIEVQNDEVYMNEIKVAKIPAISLFEAYLAKQTCDGMYAAEIALRAQISADNNKEKDNDVTRFSEYEDTV